MRFFLLLVLLSCCPLILSAQPGNPAQADSASLRTQFEEMLKASNRYQRFKVVRQDFLNAYQANVSDSIATYTDRIGELQRTIAEQEDQLTAQSQTISARDEEIVSLNKEKDSVSLLGLPLAKGTYNLILWSLIIGLVAALLFALARMRLAVGGHRELSAQQEKLSGELERSKKERLKIEQELRRKLQDEINRNRRTTS